jgi:hypothetical protein
MVDQIEDKGGKFTWKLDDPEVLQRDEQEKIQKDKEKLLRKEAARRVCMANPVSPLAQLLFIGTAAL